VGSRGGFSKESLAAGGIVFSGKKKKKKRCQVLYSWMDYFLAPISPRRGVKKRELTFKGF
jgi:hypothetical protein